MNQVRQMNLVRQMNQMKQTRSDTQTRWDQQTRPETQTRWGKHRDKPGETNKPDETNARTDKPGQTNKPDTKNIRTDKHDFSWSKLQTESILKGPQKGSVHNKDAFFQRNQTIFFKPIPVRVTSKRSSLGLRCFTHFPRWWVHLAIIDGPFHLLWSSIGPCAHTHCVVIMVKGKRSCNRHG